MAIITRLIDHFGGNSSSSSAHYKAIGHPALCHIWPPFLANWRKPAPSWINQIKPPVPGHLSSFEIWFGQLLDHATASLMTCGGISFWSLGGSCELTRSGMMRIQGPCLYGRGFFFFPSLRVKSAAALDWQDVSVPIMVGVESSLFSHFSSHTPSSCVKRAWQPWLQRHARRYYLHWGKKEKKKV